MKRWSWIVAAVALAAPNAVHAQDERLRATLAPNAYYAVRAVLDSARASGLPPEPLTAKALEGASKGADDARIVAAVRDLANRLRTARETLGSGTAAADLTSAAAVLYLGLQPGQLRRVRAVAPDDRALSSAFIALASLVQQGVPPQTSTGIVTRLVRARASDADFAILQRQIATDVRDGASPEAAAAARARGLEIGRATPEYPPRRESATENR